MEEGRQQGARVTAEGAKMAGASWGTAQQRAFTQEGVNGGRKKPPNGWPLSLIQAHTNVETQRVCSFRQGNYSGMEDEWLPSIKSIYSRSLQLGLCRIFNKLNQLPLLHLLTFSHWEMKLHHFFSPFGFLDIRRLKIVQPLLPGVYNNTQRGMEKIKVKN